MYSEHTGLSSAKLFPISATTPPPFCVQDDVLWLKACTGSISLQVVPSKTNTVVGKTWRSVPAESRTHQLQDYPLHLVASSIFQ